MIRDTCSACAFTEHGHTLRISTEGGNVIAYPAQHLQLILEPIVAGTIECLRAEETERTQAEIRRDEHNIMIEQEVGTVEAAYARAALPAAAMEPHHDGQRRRCLRHRIWRIDIQVEAILGALDEGVTSKRIPLHAHRSIEHGQTFAMPARLLHGCSKAQLTQRRQGVGYALECPHMAATVRRPMASDKPAAMRQLHVQSLRGATLRQRRQHPSEQQQQRQPSDCHCVSGRGNELIWSTRRLAGFKITTGPRNNIINSRLSA